MITGIFEGNLPFVAVTLGWGSGSLNSPFLLDTGFSGDMQVTTKVASKLGLEPLGIGKIKMADGSSASLPTALAVVNLEGFTKTIIVHVRYPFL